MVHHKFLTDSNADERKKKLDFGFWVSWIQKLSFFSHPPILKFLGLIFGLKGKIIDAKDIVVRLSYKS